MFMLHWTMPNHDCETECEHDLVTDKKLEMLLDQNEDVKNSKSHNDVLNFNDGCIGVIIIYKIVGHSYIERAMARNNQHVQFWQNTKKC